MKDGNKMIVMRYMYDDDVNKEYDIIVWHVSNKKL